MKNILLSSSLILFTSFVNAQNRGAGNVSVAIQSNANYNTSLSNGYSNVMVFNNSPNTSSNRGNSNPVNQSISNKTVNTRQRSADVIRSRQTNVQSRNVSDNVVDNVVQLRGSRNVNVNYQLNDNNEQNATEINVVQSTVNVDQEMVNVIQEIQEVNESQEKEVIAEKPEISFAPTLNIDINLPKPNITFDLKVKEEKEVIEKSSVLKIKSGSGIAKVKKKTKSRKNKRSKGRHQYSQKVKVGTVLRNTVSTLKHKLKKTKTKKGVFSVVCYKF